MDWILDHLQLILAIAGAIAYWLNARKKEQSGEPADYDGDDIPDTRPQAGGSFREQDETQLQDENTRRIQDEIRRKIAERQGGGSTWSEAAPLPIPSSRGTDANHLPTARPLSTAQPPLLRREYEPSPFDRDEARRASVEREAATVLDRQRALAAQIEMLNQRREDTARSARAMRDAGELATGAGSASSLMRKSDDGLLSDLRNASSLRKAIVLREVLGTPVGLR